MHNLGHTRSAVHRDHLLLTPDTFVRTPLPCIREGAAIVHIAPAGGASFTQYTAELDAGGMLASTPAQRFVFVLSGAATLTSGAAVYGLKPDDFAFLPAGVDHSFIAKGATRLAVIEKHYIALPGVEPPTLVVGTESNLASAPLLDDSGVQVRALLPDLSGFDFAVNTMTYEPGASLSRVESHVMEHGLLMLEGGGIYRLGEAWYPVTAGDFIWMAPFCPQWFGALGKQPAKYLIYKDWNRHPLL
jgi:(S)-ureidoglycine aminohydrolase